MGTINYMTSSYITMGLNPYDISDYEDENGNIDYDLLEMDYEDDRTNIENILSRYSFYYFHVAIKAGYYEGFSLDIENNFSVAFDGWEDKRAAQKEITSLKQCLLECAGSGLVACYPGWCTGYEDYKGTCKAIAAAIKDMREEVKITPTWLQYERETA